MLTIWCSPLIVLINSNHNTSGSHHPFNSLKNIISFLIGRYSSILYLEVSCWSTNIVHCKHFCYTIAFGFLFLHIFSIPIRYIHAYEYSSPSSSIHLLASYCTQQLTLMSSHFKIAVSKKGEGEGGHDSSTSFSSP